jgi:translation initiation factor 4B
VAEKPAADEETADDNDAESEHPEPTSETKEAETDVTSPTTATNGEQKVPIRAKEPRGEGVPNYKSRASESGNWRQSSGEHRGGSRGGHPPSGPRRGGGPPRGPRNEGGRPPRANGSGPATVHQAQPPQSGGSEPSTPTPDEDGWTTVPNKSRRGQSGRPSIAL